MKPILPADAELFTDIRRLIDEARRRVVIAVNAELTLLHWQVGQRIRKDILEERRADYGSAVVASLARRLTEAYGKSWGEKQLRHCLRVAERIELDPHQDAYLYR